jgi:hypothetical protein
MLLYIGSCLCRRAEQSLFGVIQWHQQRGSWHLSDSCKKRHGDPLDPFCCLLGIVYEASSKHRVRRAHSACQAAIPLHCCEYLCTKSPSFADSIMHCTNVICCIILTPSTQQDSSQ